MSEQAEGPAGISRPADEDEPLTWEAIDTIEERLEEFPWKDWSADEVRDLVREIRYLQGWVINLECRVTGWRLFWNRHKKSDCREAPTGE